MANINNIRTDLNKEVDGVWVNFVEGIRLKIARARNSKYVEFLRSLTENKRKEIRNDDIKTEDFADILMQVRAKTILLGWENIQDDNGNEILYSYEQALEFFRDKELKDFYNFVVGVSENINNYKKDLVKESEKN